MIIRGTMFHVCARVFRAIQLWGSFGGNLKRLDSKRRTVSMTLMTGKLSENGPKNSPTKLIQLSSLIANVHWVGDKIQPQRALIVEIAHD